MATSDKQKLSGICVGTGIGSSGLQMILEAAGHIEDESNVASQNDIRIGSTDCFNISHRLPEVDDDNRGHEPFYTSEISIETSDHPSPSCSSGNGTANLGLAMSPGSSDPTISNHLSEEPNRMQYFATDQIAGNLCK